MSCCPTCGRTITAAKSPKEYQHVTRWELDRKFFESKQITKDQYFAGCKAIATRDDAAFFLRVTGDRCPEGIYAQVRELLAELETRKATTADAKRLWNLKWQYRCFRATQTRDEWHVGTSAAA